MRGLVYCSLSAETSMLMTLATHRCRKISNGCESLLNVKGYPDSSQLLKTPPRFTTKSLTVSLSSFWTPLPAKNRNKLESMSLKRSQNLQRSKMLKPTSSRRVWRRNTRKTSSTTWSDTWLTTSEWSLKTEIDSHLTTFLWWCGIWTTKRWRTNWKSTWKSWSS